MAEAWFGKRLDKSDPNAEPQQGRGNRIIEKEFVLPPTICRESMELNFLELPCAAAKRLAPRQHSSTV
jgi:hypothetical protein